MVRPMFHRSGTVGKGEATSSATAASATAASTGPFHPDVTRNVAGLFAAGSVFTDGYPLPRLIVFDLDYTLWPFWVDTHVTPPLRLAKPDSVSGGGRRRASAWPTATERATGAVRVVDRNDELFCFYADVPSILQALAAVGVRIGVASRTSAPELARDMLRLLQVPVGTARALADTDEGAPAVPLKTGKAWDVFDAGLEIYPTDKRQHMEILQRRTGLPYNNFLFFDDERRNRNVETLGVTMCLVEDGVSWPEIERGVRQWRAWNGHPGAR